MEPSGGERIVRADTESCDGPTAIDRVEAVFLLGALFAAAWAANGLFAGHGALVPLTGAVLIPSALVLLAHRRTRRLDMLAALTLAGFVAYALTLLFGLVTGRGTAGVADFVAALPAGWSSLLTVGLPADPDPTLLVVPALLLWLASSISVVLAGAPTKIFVPLLPAGAVFVVMLALASASGRSALPAAGLLGATALGFALVRSEQVAHGGRARQAGTPGPRGADSGGRPSWLPSGRLLLGLPVLVLAVVSGVVTGLLLPSAGGFDPRTLRDPPLATSQELNPLVEIRSQLTAAPPRRIATVRLASSSGRLPVDRVTTAILGDFDGARWRNDDAFVTTGRVPARGDLAPVEPAVTVRADITVDGAGSPLLPGVGWPTRISGAELAFDPGSGGLLSTAPAGSGQHYQLTASVPAPDPARLTGAVAGSGPALTEYLRVPTGVPAELVAVATAATAQARTPYAQLTALERFLRDPDRFPYDLGGRPGHSYGSLARMVTSPDIREHRGYAEQHAAAFAVLARVRGFPSRIAVGYLLGPDTEGGRGAFTITQARAHAWPEIYLKGIGWVPFEPTDISNLTRQEPVDAASADAGPAADVAADVTDQPAPSAAAPIPLLDSRSSGGGGIRGFLLWALLALLALVMATPPAIVGEKRRRRWRRRVARTPDQRIAGAWREARDRLWEWGVSPDRSRSAAEVANDARVLGPHVADVTDALGSLMSAATFGRHGATEADAARAWELVSTLSDRVGEGRSLLRRLRAGVSVLPLLGVRHARAASVGGGDAA